MGQHLDRHIARYVQGDIEHHDLLAGWDDAVALDETAEQERQARLQEMANGFAGLGTWGWTTEEAAKELLLLSGEQGPELLHVPAYSHNKWTELYQRGIPSPWLTTLEIVCVGIGFLSTLAVLLWHILH